VAVPDVVQFNGDLLSQAYADVPNVSFTTAPAAGTNVSGTISFGAAASLTNPGLATGIAKLRLSSTAKIRVNPSRPRRAISTSIRAA